MSTVTITNVQRIDKTFNVEYSIDDDNGFTEKKVMNFNDPKVTVDEIIDEIKKESIIYKDVNTNTEVLNQLIGLVISV